MKYLRKTLYWLVAVPLTLMIECINGNVPAIFIGAIVLAIIFSLKLHGVPTSIVFGLLYVILFFIGAKLQNWE